MKNSIKIYQLVLLAKDEFLLHYKFNQNLWLSVKTGIGNWRKE